MTTKQKKINNLEPAETDCYYKYICPSCGCSHWISHKEACTHDFKIVCDCDIILSPKKILDINLQYDIPKDKTKKRKKKNKKKKDFFEEFGTLGQSIDIEQEEKFTAEEKRNIEIACESLVNYGYDEKESIAMIERAFEICEDKDAVNLVKVSLTRIGKEHEYFYNQTYDI